MKYTISAAFCAIIDVLPRRIHSLAVVCVLGLALVGHPLEVSAGWYIWPPAVYATPARRRWAQDRPRAQPPDVGAAQMWVSQTWPVPFCRSLLLAGFWLAGGHDGLSWGALVPWLAWACTVVSLVCPGVLRYPEWRLVQRMATPVMHSPLWLALGLLVDHGLIIPGSIRPRLVCGLVAGQQAVTVEHDAAQHCYHARLSGTFSLRVADDQSVRLRFLLLFLRLLDDDSAERGSRRTRDGRTPVVRQEMLSAAVGIPQPVISRWEGYWQRGDWRRLLSQHAPEVLTYDLMQQIITTWAHWPQWTAQQVWPVLRSTGVAVTLRQVRQAGRESGWQIVRQVLGEHCVAQAADLRLREDWLISTLVTQVEMLVGKLEAGRGLTPQETLDVTAERHALAAAGLAGHASKALRPWLRQVEQVLFRPWDETMVGDIRCTYCGAADVGRKSSIPRFKRVIDTAGEVRWVAVYRYYCHNPSCAKKSFTAFPPGVLPYTVHTVETHVLALQMYAWSRSVYRRTGEAVGVAAMTAYRWVSAFGAELLPVAALFGVVKSSGVVGVDEKWVLVPKNGKAAGENRRWMYVYLAVDCYTYDLLHIAIYERNTKESARAFLLALRAKGYRPRVVVTDLRQDYGPALAAVFPHAQHHECLFHAGKALHHQLWDACGRERYRTDQQIIALRKTLDGVLAAETKRTAQRRYDEVMAQRDALVAAEPRLDGVFATLETHWPKLVNGIESDLIPRTNNTVELVIRRFDQHYHNMCGFESVQTAAVFLGVFEKVYRFTPFSQDAQKRLRGKSPLELAGYNVSQMPMAAVCRGWALSPLLHPPEEVVPNG